MAEENEEGLLRTATACSRAALGRTKLDELIRDGHVEVVWIGGARRVVASSLDQYIQSLRSTNPKDGVA